MTVAAEIVIPKQRGQIAAIFHHEGVSQPVDPGRAQIEAAMVIGAGGRLPLGVDQKATHQGAVSKLTRIIESFVNDA